MAIPKRLFMRIEVLKMGADQLLLAFAIKWVLENRMEYSVEVEWRPHDPPEKLEDGWFVFEQILFKAASGRFKGSQVHSSLDLPNFRQRLEGKFDDLWAGSGTTERAALVQNFEVLRRAASAAFHMQKQSAPANNQCQLQFEASAAEFERWIKNEVGNRMGIRG